LPGVRGSAFREGSFESNRRASLEHASDAVKAILPAGAGQAVGQLNLVQLSLDGPSQARIVDVARDEQRLDDLSERPERPVKRMLAGLGTERLKMSEVPSF